ncbi:MAG: hypothetical protein H6882_06030 [Rhodobiaceae bacterium]|nr:hypothetical protein [Rhodobiaceae bacterium]
MNVLTRSYAPAPLLASAASCGKVLPSPASGAISANVRGDRAITISSTRRWPETLRSLSTCLDHKPGYPFPGKA